MLLSKTESQKCKSAHATRVRTRPSSAPTPARMTISSNSLPFSHSGHQLRVMTSTIPLVVYYTTLILPPCLLSIVERDSLISLPIFSRTWAVGVENMVFCLELQQINFKIWQPPQGCCSYVEGLYHWYWYSVPGEIQAIGKPPDVWMWARARPLPVFLYSLGNSHHEYKVDGEWSRAIWSIVLAWRSLQEHSI